MVAAGAHHAGDVLEGFEVLLAGGRRVGQRRGVAGGQAAGLEDAAVVAGAIVVEALADDLASLDDDATVAEVERREGGLLEAEIEVVVGLHFALNVRSRLDDVDDACARLG